MNWRRLLGLDRGHENIVIAFDPAVTAFKARKMVQDVFSVRGEHLNGSRTARFADRIAELENYRPPNQRGNPLADKDKTRVHGLHLDDYQPRSYEHAVQRITFERAYPPLPEWREEDEWLRQRANTSWVDFRNRSPLVEGGWQLPPMRDALADLQEHLRMVERKLAEQMLVAVEVSVEHEPTPSRVDGSGQGWNFAVHLLAVPQGVLDAERERHEAFLAEQEKHKAELLAAQKGARG